MRDDLPQLIKFFGIPIFPPIRIFLAAAVAVVTRTYLLNFDMQMSHFLQISEETRFVFLVSCQQTLSHRFTIIVKVFGLILTFDFIGGFILAMRQNCIWYAAYDMLRSYVCTKACTIQILDAYKTCTTNTFFPTAHRKRRLQITQPTKMMRLYKTFHHIQFNSNALLQLA